MPETHARGRWPLLPVVVCVAIGLAGACGRSPLEFGPVIDPLPIIDAGAVVDVASEPIAEVAPEVAPDLAPDVPPDVPPDLPPEAKPETKPDVMPDLPRETAPEAPAERPPVEAGPVCHPVPETCNGVDDDCNGKVDEDQPPIPCPGGASRYCVGGRYSECPRRCEVCVPGSQRECFTSFCTFWGTQSCTSDGRSFGTCKEGAVPSVCKAVAQKHMKSRELEQCCLDNGFCCNDDYDLDKDGITAEMIGRCESVMCGS